jgi:two-component system phosphate regulon sensor histidine kinase PhoR
MLDTRKLKYVIAAISISIIGLSLVQIYWIHNELEIEAKRFNRNVYDALNFSCRRLERINLMKEGKTPVQQMLEQLLNQERDYYKSFLGGDTNAFDLTRKRPAGIQKMLDDLNEQKKEAEKIVLDSITLQNLISIELQSRGVDLPFHFLYGNPDKEKSLIVSNKKYLDKIIKSPYQAVIYSGSIFNNPDYLSIYFPRKNAYLFKNIWTTLLISVLFLTIIILSFIYSIKTIFSQKKLSVIKSDFINNITHELKTPLSTISLASEALSVTPIADEDKLKRYLGLIKDETKRLQSLIENVLTTSITEKEGFKLNKEKVDLFDVIKETVNRTQVNIEANNGKLDFDFDTDDIKVYGDKLHLTNVFYNLFDNAIKYRKGQPEIKLTISVQKNWVVLTVSDNGIGIKKEDQSRIFDSLYRVPTGNIHNVKGFGLGLNYCKNIITKHNGNIDVESTLGVGTTFTIKLPIYNEMDIKKD